jgi:hypothetical protein
MARAQSAAIHAASEAEWRLAQLVGGAEGGAAASLAMALVWMALDRGRTDGGARPMELVATALLGQRALDGGLVAFAVGLVLHLAVGAAWGALFSRLVPRATTGPAAALLGASFSLIVFFVMGFVVVPAVAPLVASMLHPGSYLVAHLAYGLSLGIVVPLRRRALNRLD